MFQKLFKRRYLESLRFYKHFYDDIYEYGSRDDPTKVFYFIPGISGVPGQVRRANARRPTTQSPPRQRSFRPGVTVAMR